MAGSRRQVTKKGGKKYVTTSWTNWSVKENATGALNLKYRSSRSIG